MKNRFSNEDTSYMMHPETMASVIISSSVDGTKVGVHHYRAYLPSVLEDYQALVPLFDILYNAGVEDTVTLILNGDGGYATTAAHLASAIGRSQATVITEAAGRTSSAHTIALLSGDVILPVRNTIVMAHNMSLGSHGSGAEPIKHVQASLEWGYSFFEEYQLPFLSIEEIDSIFEHNETFWFPHEVDVNNRIYTTMWYRAVMGMLKPDALHTFLAFINAGVYQECQLTNLDTVLQGLDEICEDAEVDSAHLWELLSSHGLLGEHDNPVDFVLSLQ